MKLLLSVFNFDASTLFVKSCNEMHVIQRPLQEYCDGNVKKFGHYLCCSKLVSHQRVCSEGEDGDENRCRRPEIDTHSVQVLTTLQALQLGLSEICDLRLKVALPGIELYHTNTK